MKWFSKQGGVVDGKVGTVDGEVAIAMEPDKQGAEDEAERLAVPAPIDVLDTPPADPPCSGPDRFTQAVDALATKQDELNRLFEDRLRSDQVQANALQHLHTELRAYRDNFIRQTQLDVLKDVMHCYDFANMEHAPGAEASATSFDHLKVMLADLLFKFDIEPFQSESDDFDRDTQQCLRTVATTEPEKDRKVAARGLVGFRSQGGVLRKEQVTIFKFNTPTGV